MKRHVKDFRGFSTNESFDQEPKPLEDYWVLYYFEDYQPNFLSLHRSGADAEVAWYEAIDDVFGDQIYSWMYGNVPEEFEDLDDLISRDPEGYEELHREAIEWASDELAYDTQFNYESLRTMMRDDRRILNLIMDDLLDDPILDDREKRSIQRRVGMGGMFDKP
jgi:hypothetical protein